jgi:peptidoglycan/xylan/chitin deacetylase (PgdA/CDA1 family)
MRKIRRIFAWICHPQALVGFVVLCLSVSGIGVLLRSATTNDVVQFGSPAPLLRASVPGPHLDCNSKPCLALTFDDGPNAIATPQVLDVLARQQVRATFFVVGVHVPGNDEIVRREFREGHEIGNHSWNHPDLSKLSPEDAQTQIEMTQRVISQTGVPTPKILRPPFGAVNDMLVAHNNLTIVRWNVDPEDWKVQDPAKIQQQLLANVRPGAIILMHDIYPTTAAALEPVLQALKQQYQFVTVSQLLDLTPGDQGQFFARYK